MKIRKIQILRLLQNMMESYNAFTTVESLDRKVEAWYDKLQYQNEEFVSKSFHDWNGTKMPTAPEILKKCFEMHADDKNDYAADNLVCEYSRYSHEWEYECEISKSLCHNNWNEEEKNNINLCNIDFNGHVFMVCSFHRRKIRAIFENSESCKMIVDGLIEFKKQTYSNDIHLLSKQLTENITVDLK